MSASREKKTRQDLTSQGPAERDQKRQKEEKSDRRSMLLYGGVALVVVVAAIAMMVWNSGLIQRSATAATINGTKYTAADVQYYFNGYYNTYYAWGIFDTSTSLKNQVQDEESGATWYDFLLDRSLEAMAADTAMADKAQAEGYTLSQEGQASIDNTLQQLNSTWVVRGYSSRDAFLQAMYGPYMTYNQFVSILTKQTLASDFADATRDALTYTDADYDAYYKEHTTDLDTFTLSQFVFQATVDNSNSELSEEQVSSALAELKTEKKAQAEALQAKLEAGESPDALAEEYADDLASSQISTSQMGSGVNAAFRDWAAESARKNGDVTLIESDSDTSCTYYVVRFENRERADDDLSCDVRHILAAAETDEGAEEPTAEQFAAAKARAEEWLSQWQAGAADEDSFATLAAEYSEDGGSASSGGLIAGVTASSNLVDPFKEWTLNPARKPGDTGLVQTSYGWHVMYYVSSTPTWKAAADSSLRSADYSAWEASVQEGYEATRESGLKYVQG